MIHEIRTRVLKILVVNAVTSAGYWTFSPILRSEQLSPRALRAINPFTHLGELSRVSMSRVRLTLSLFRAAAASTEARA